MYTYNQLIIKHFLCQNIVFTSVDLLIRGEMPMVCIMPEWFGATAKFLYAV